MKTNLVSLIREIQDDSNSREESLIEVINLFTPKIKTCLQQTSYQYQEDLHQQLIISVIEIAETYDVESTPGFLEYIDKNEATKQT